MYFCDMAGRYSSEEKQILYIERTSENWPISNYVWIVVSQVAKAQSCSVQEWHRNTQVFYLSEHDPFHSRVKIMLQDGQIGKKQQKNAFLVLVGVKFLLWQLNRKIIL